MTTTAAPSESLQAQSRGQEARVYSLRSALLLIILLAVGLRLYLLFAAHATEEDFYITLRYAENIAAGRGFVYNVGERVLGTTTPLYALILALFLRLHLDPVLGGKLLGILADGFACWCVARLGRAIGRPGAGLAAALCLAVAPTNLVWATKGMEVGLAAAAGVAAWTAWAERRETPAWIAAAVLVLLRIDGAALAVVLLAATLVRDRRVPWRGLLAFAALTLPWLAFSIGYFGSPIPTSLRAKMAVYAWHAPGAFPNLFPFLRLMTHNPLGMFLMFGVLLSGVLRFGKAGSALRFPPAVRAVLIPGIDARPLSALRERESLPAVTFPSPYKAEGSGEATAPEGRPSRRAARSVLSLSRFWRSQGEDEEKGAAPFPAARSGGEGLLLAPLCWMLLYYGGMAFSKVFLFGWYFVPPTPIYYLVALTGWSLIGERMWGSRPAVWRTWNPVPTGAWAALAGMALSLAFVPRAASTLQEGQRVEERLRIPIGHWLREHAAPSERVMLEPIGYIGYWGGLRVLDTIGLVSPEVLPCYREDTASPLHAIWQRFRPEWALLRGGEWNDLRRYERRLPAPERLEARYALTKTWLNLDGRPGDHAAFFLFRRR
jgi:hypothetical protein